MIRALEPAEGRDLPSRHAARRGIWGLVVAFLVLGILYSVTTPLFEASDELWHYPFVQHLAKGNGLPVQDPAVTTPWRQEGSQPPLYYALVALITHWVPTDHLPELRQINPHADIGVPQPDRNANMVIHTRDLPFPYQGAALAVYLSRWFSVVLGAITVLAAYGLGLEVLPRRPNVALAGAAGVAFTPMFLFIAGSVNNDNLLIALSTVALWYTVRLLRLPPQPARWLPLGLLIGLAALSKTSGLALFAPAGLTLAWDAWRRRDVRLFLLGGTAVVGMAVLVGGWWYWRNWRLYGDPLGLNVFVAIVGARHPQPSLRHLMGEWRGFVMAYWGFFGGVNVPAPEWFYRLLNAMAMLGAGGLFVGGIRRLWQRRWPDADSAFRLALMVLWPLIMSASLVRWTLMTIASQGRLIFPALASICWLMMLGLGSWIPHPRWRIGPLVVAVVLMVGLAVWIPFGVIAPAYARPPLLSPEQLEAVHPRMDLAFGESLVLLGYEVDANPIAPGERLPVTLYWQALEPMEHNYSVFIHLLGEQEIILGQRNLYPGGGTFPTTLWAPGDAIADTYFVPVPETALPTTSAEIEVGLYRHETGERLPVADSSGTPLGDHVRLGPVRLGTDLDAEGPMAAFRVNLDDKIALVGYDLDRVALAPGDSLHLTLYWKALAPMSENYTVFAQVLGDHHSLWAQEDAWPQDGAAPTAGWQPGQQIVDEYILTLRDDTPPGVYQLQVGFYLGETLERLPVLGPGGHVRDDRVLLNPIRVVAR